MKINYQSALLYLLLFSLLVLAIPSSFYQYDVDLFISWAVQIFEKGLGNIYAAENNDYNPLYHYILYVYGKLAGSVEKIVFFKNYLKVFTLIFDFAAAIVAASLVKEHYRRFTYSLLLLFNIGYLYNTLIWGQVDGIFTCLAFVAVVLAVKNRPAWSVAFFVLALNAKTQGIIFLPILLLLWLPTLVKQPKKLASLLGAGVLTQFLILIPFIWGGEQSYLGRIYYLNFNAVGRIPFVSFNAFNIWNLFMPDLKLYTVPDNLLYGGITYRAWGLIMFFLASGLALIPLALLSFRNMVKRYGFTSENYPLVMLTAGIIPLIFCFFNTEMHERYWHPAIIFLGAAAFLSRFYVIYVLASIAYFLNLEAVFQYLKLYKRTILLLDEEFIAGLFALAIVLGIYKLYAKADLRAHWQELRQSVAARKQLVTP